MFNKNKLLTNRQLLLLLQHFRHIRSDSGVNNRINKKFSKARNNDYLGILSADKKEVSGIHHQSPIDLNQKYSPLLDKRDAKVNEQKFLITSFGKVRLDSDNKPAFHGQYDEGNDQNKFDINQFEDYLNNHSNSAKIESEPTKVITTDNNIVEEQYFGQLNEQKHSTIHNKNDESIDSDNEFEFIDSQYFSKNANFEPLYKSKINFKFSQEFIELRKEKGEQYKSLENLNNQRTKSEQFNAFDSPLKQELFSADYEVDYDFLEKRRDIENLNESDFDEKEAKVEDNQMEQIKLEEVKKVELLSPKPKTGAEYLRDIQTGKAVPNYNKHFTEEIKKFGAQYNLRGEKLDSKGFQILKGQVFDYSKMTNEDIVEMLVKRVLFNDADIVAINKPYGISIHSNKESKSGPVLTEFLPKLSERFNCEQLYTVHRLDKDTTGILLLTKTQEKAHLINRLFTEHKITKQYYCITRGVPDDPEGVIDIPIEIGRVDGKERMVLRPEALEEYRSVIKPSKTAKRAVTQYRVISESKNAALLEVLPQTGIRHQIRVHLGFGLRCPILGDHKYSHLDKIAPQKLTADMLVALNVRQSKVRHIPMHLHARQYCIPQAGKEGRNIFINAPLPPHFIRNMASLKLRQ